MALQDWTPTWIFLPTFKNKSADDPNMPIRVWIPGEVLVVPPQVCLLLLLLLFFFFYYIIILYFAATTAIHCVNKNKKHKNIANRNDKESKVQYHKDSKLYIPHCNTIEE